MILHAVEAGHPTGRPPVVLLHGLFGSARNFGTVQRELAQDFRVLALDLRNHGESPHAASMDYDTMADDVRETLIAKDALPAVLIGHSMGGKTAMRLALREPQSVSQLVVVDIAPVRYMASHRVDVAAMQGIPLEPGLTRAQADAALAKVEPSAMTRGFLLQNLRLDSERPRWRVGLQEIAAAMGDLEDWPDLPGALSYPGPCLFLAGALSPYVRPEYRNVIRALFPRAQVVTVKNAGHLVHAEQPSVFLSALRRFLTNPS